MVAYALSVAEYIGILEPSAYEEDISSGEAIEWIIAMIEEIVSSQEPDMKVNGTTQGTENY